MKRKDKGKGVSGTKRKLGLGVSGRVEVSVRMCVARGKRDNKEVSNENKRRYKKVKGHFFF